MKIHKWFVPVRSLAVLAACALLMACTIALISCGSTGRIGGGGGNSFQAQNGVFTRHFNNARTGANTSETILTPAGVASGNFGVLFSDPVDSFVIAQPLFVPGVSIGGATHNVVFVATENNTVYAFDADKAGPPLWQASMNPPGGQAVPCTEFDPGGAGCIAPTLGITATPVIDPSTGTMFVEARSEQGGSYSHHLHALDITTGHERSGSPVTITATVNGVAFDPFTQNSRPALLLLNGVVYVSFGSVADLLTFRGWLMGFDAHSLQRVSVLLTTPNGDDGSIWHATGPASDGTNIFVIVANGDFNPAANDWGDTVLKLSSQMKFLDTFTPFNQDVLDSTDSDMGSGGILLLPSEVGGGAPLAITAGKEGRIYLLNLNHLGGFNAGSDQVQQEVIGQLGGGSGGCGQLPHCSGTDVNFNTPAYWNGKVYFGAMNDTLKAFSISNGQLSATPTMASTIGTGVLGEAPVVSANGNQNGIVWVLDFENGFLRAFDANDLAHELFESGLNVTEFSEPVVFNGKVYVGTQFDLTVFGMTK